jgi:hypothetical protein
VKKVQQLQYLTRGDVIRFSLFWVASFMRARISFLSMFPSPCQPHFYSLSISCPFDPPPTRTLPASPMRVYCTICWQNV